MSYKGLFFLFYPTEPDNRGQGPLAMPLCLPNNYEWDPQTRKCNKTGPKRSSLYVIKEALDDLRKIKGKFNLVHGSFVSHYLHNINIERKVFQQMITR